VIFSRGRGSGRHHKAEQAARHSARRRTRDEFGFDDDDADNDPVPSVGPYDVEEAPEGVERLDLGSLQIPAIAGVEVRVQADAEGQVQQVILVDGESALQLGVFAAPRSEGIWDEVLADIRKQLFSDGVAAEEVDGDYGIELRARVRTPEGVTDLRFVGIDGPRWMVRGVYQGPAAVDPGAAGSLTECLRGLVVDRGVEAMPVREPLPLRLPREMAEQARAAGEPSADQRVNGTPAQAAGRRKPSPRPRRRG
jgi:Protein of unknown function (DUF3710)